MFRLLIVDDEAIIANGIKSSVDWKSIGFSEVETAYNIRQAKDAFALESFDVMISDIEMPQGTGFDLFAWTREKYPKTECIFLTCHAEFEFAKKAVQLGSLDYLLKPVPAEELAGAVTMALNKIWRERGIAARLLEQFWLEVLRQDIPARIDFILKQATRHHLSYTETTLFLPVLIHIDFFNKELSAKDESPILYALRNALDELVMSHFYDAHSVHLSRSDFVLIIPSECYSNQLVDELHVKMNNYCNTYIQACEKNFYCHLSCYIGKMIPIDRLAEMCETLVETQRNQVNAAGRIFLFDEEPHVVCDVKVPNMQVWSEMLRNLEKRRLLDEVRVNLESWKNAENLSVKQLQLFYQSFLQSVLHTLQQSGLRAEEILHELLAPELAVTATHSVRDLQIWVTEVIEIAVSSMKALSSNETIVEKIQRYIELHLDDQLSRQYIADYVCLSPDYVVKLFKKETGLSISDYILKERLSRAKELLIKSKMSISDVALSVGYTNFSYFSTMFRKETSMTPQDFRKQHA
ncbi:helix-turn-helix domain-containing protein [Radiobacillus sp. PE A8.2]|uniref:response regulator transcription factor n=1 Tax=Radiobacillus sp. PE A8.2 TaxID=3380349 RepID=UPI00388F2ECA